MSRLFIIVASFLTIAGCAQSKCLKQLKQDVSTQWRYNDTAGYFIIGDSLLNNIQHRRYNCLRGLDTSVVYDIFGHQYSKITRDFPPGFRDSLNAAIEYPLSVPLDSIKGTGSSFSLRAYFNYSGKIMFVRKQGDHKIVSD